MKCPVCKCDNPESQRTCRVCGERLIAEPVHAEGLLKTVPGKPGTIEELNEDQVFEFSCKAAIAMQSLNENIEKNKKVVNRAIYSDEEFISNYIQRNFRKTSTGTNILLGLLSGFLAFVMDNLIFVGLLKNSKNDSPMISVVVIIFFGVFFWLFKRLMNTMQYNKVRACGESLLPNYRTTRQTFYEREKPEAIKAIENDKQEVKKIENILKQLSNRRNCLPQEYYGCAGELLYLYQIKRADNLKEAINVWETMQFQIRQAEMMQEISDQVEYNKKMLARAEEYARQAAADAERAADNAETASWLSMLDLLSD